MDKIRDILRYIDTVKSYDELFKRYYFHSLVDLNLIKLDSILKHGILSKKMIQQENLINLYTHNAHDFDSKNGDNLISLTQYTDDCKFSATFESFALHTLTSLSLLVNKRIDVVIEGKRDTLFDDEIFCYNSIPISDLEGIILPEHLAILPIDKVSFLSNDISCYTKSYLNHWISCIESYFNINLSQELINDIKVSYEQLWNILNHYENPDRWIESAIREERNQYGKDLKDVLANILQEL